MDNQTLLSRIRERFPQAVRSSTESHGALSIDLHADAYLALATWLRDEPTLRYNFLENICGVDYLGRTPRFEVVAHLVSMQHLHRVCLKVGLPEHNPTIASLTPLFATANYQERETYDLLGIIFTDHPSLTRILMPDDWIGHPQRKDHPLGDEEVAFTFNQEQIYARKPFARE